MSNDANNARPLLKIGDSPPTYTHLSDIAKQKYTLTPTENLALAFAQFANYSNYKIFWPFAIFFAQSYGIELSKFSIIVGAYGYGAVLSIFVSHYLIHCKLHYSVFLTAMLSAIANFLTIFFSSFTELLILRILSGLFGTLAWSTVTAGIGTLIADKSNRQLNVMITEATWSLSTLAYTGFGVVLHHYSVDAVWLIYTILFVAVAMFGILVLPRVSISYASVVNSMIDSKMKLEHRSSELWPMIRTFLDTPHIITLFFLRGLISIIYCGALVSTALWMQSQFELSPQSMGLQTILTLAAEFFALVTVPFVSKRLGSTVFTLRLAIVGWCLFAFIFMAFVHFFDTIHLGLIDCLSLSQHHSNMAMFILSMLMLFMFLMSLEYTVLNMIVLCLDWAPVGFESIATNLFWSIGCLSTAPGSAAALIIMKRTGNSLQYVMFMQGCFAFLACLLLQWMHRMQQTYQRNKMCYLDVDHV